MSKKQRNVFSGEHSVINFLTPDNNNPTPLVELPKKLNPYYKDKVRIYAKLMNTTPLGNLKSLPALAMMQDAKTHNVDTIIENSSGNTVMSLAVIARLLGIPRAKAYVSNEITTGKLRMLRLMGVEAIVNKEPICPDPNDTTSGIYKAKAAGRRKKWFNPGQYDNTHNPNAHYRWTGPQIWEQTDGALSIFCTGLGTTGTMVGTGRFLKEKNANIQTVGVARIPNNPVPGVRTPSLLGQIAFDWKTITDHLEHVGTHDAYHASCELCRHGLFVGPSSGLALHGLLSFLAKSKAHGTLEMYKNNHGEIVCVFVCCDSPLPYLDEYFAYLPDTHFPPVRHAELLNTVAHETSTAYITKNDREITISDFCNQHIHDLVIDVRTAHEYADGHIAHTRNINHQDILDDISSYAKKWNGRSVITVCQSGNRSLSVAQALADQGIDVQSLAGGMIEWSRQNLPRVRPSSCRQ